MAAAYGPGFKFHDENLLMLSWYATRITDGLRRMRARSLLSLGIGHRVVSRALFGLLGDPLDSYVVVEGSKTAVQELAAENPPAGVTLEHAFFEDYRPPSPVDAVEMGFVLEHVLDPLLVLRRYAGFVRPGGLLFIAVPNARALHRVVGQRAGLLEDVHRLSEHDLQLGHRRYFDLSSLQELVRSAGLTAERTEGIFLKCLTTDQLKRLALPPQVLWAFCEVGAAYPEVANAIYLEART
jgi:SAM-dependent methyltransferase